MHYKLHVTIIVIDRYLRQAGAPENFDEVAKVQTICSDKD